MATTIEKFVFECSESGSEQVFQMPETARVVYVKINSQYAAAIYAIVDSDVPVVSRKFQVFHSRKELPSKWVYIGTSCNGAVTYHVGEVLDAN